MPSDSNVDRAALGKRNKRAGHSGEVYYRDEFRDLGYDKCVTSRLGSRLHDMAGVDLIMIPYNVQIKVGQQKGLKPKDELIKISHLIKKYFLEDSVQIDYPKLVVHKMDVGRGNKATEFHEIVTMTFKDFKFLAKKIKDLEDKIKTLENGDK